MLPNRDEANSSPIQQSPEDPDMFYGVHRSILEAFDNLPMWNNKDRFEDFFVKESFAINTIHSKFVPFIKQDLSLPPLSTEPGEAICYLPGLPHRYQSFFPNTSVLNSKEQKILFTFFCRMSYKNCLKGRMNENELRQFQELRSKVAEENFLFQEFAKNDWCKSQWQRVLQIPPEVETFIDSLWKMRASQCLTMYPENYQSGKLIPLTLHDGQDGYSEFNFVKIVHFQGKFPPKMVLPKITKPIRLITDLEVLGRIKPISRDLQDQPEPFMSPTEPISMDSCVENLVRSKYLNVDVVISMSGIKTLTDPNKFSKDWILPVTVKEVVKQDGVTKKKVVFIDKNLPPNRMTVNDKNLWHAKVVAKWVLIFHSNPKLLDKLLETGPTDQAGTSNKPKTATTTETDRTAFIEATSSLEQLESKKPTRAKKRANRETFRETCKEITENQESYENLLSGFVERLKTKKSGGVEQASAAAQKEQPEVSAKKNLGARPTDQAGTSNKPKTATTTETDRTALNEAASLLEQLGSTAKKPTRAKKRAKRKKKQPSPSLVGYDDVLADPASEDVFVEEFGVNPVKPEPTGFGEKTPKGRSTKKAKKKVTTPDPGDRARKTGLNNCCQYQLWKIHKSNFNQFLKTEQRSLNVMVRTRRDGILSHYENQVKVEDEICVSAKVEFQPEYGAAKMTVGELVREYVDLYLRPGSKLVRVRSVGHTKELMMTEVKTLSDIKMALQAETQQIHKLFDPLYTVFTKLVDLPPGRYMLRHTVKMEAFAVLLTEHKGSPKFSLSQYCAGFTEEEVHVPPVPIDPLILTQLNHRDKAPPAVFKPAPTLRKDGVKKFSPVSKKRKRKMSLQAKNAKKQKNLKKKRLKEQKMADKDLEKKITLDYFGNQLSEESK